MEWVDSAEKDNQVRWTAACFDQMYLGDPDVLIRTAFCEHRYGISRGVAEEKIGGRRQRFEYVEDLASSCIDLREVRRNDGEWFWCWVGLKHDVMSDKEFFKGKFEECYAEFGLEALLTWKDQVCWILGAYFLLGIGRFVSVWEDLC